MKNICISKQVPQRIGAIRLHMATAIVSTELKAINCFPEHTFQHLRCYLLNCIDNTISKFG
jgi:hypothetical protein